VIPARGLKNVAPRGRLNWEAVDDEEARMPSVAFDESLLRTMSDYIVAVNRLRHAQDHVASPDDAVALRALTAGEEEAERRCVAALLQRGWQPPYVVLARGA
jgi:hypothetical protein